MKAGHKLAKPAAHWSKRTRVIIAFFITGYTFAGNIEKAGINTKKVGPLPVQLLSENRQI